MFEVSGKFNTAKIFTDVIDNDAIAQIINMCNQVAFKDSQVRIMPDVHAGAGCTIGTTMTITDKVIPNLVGADIGCGMEVCELGKVDIDFSKLDSVIRTNIPSGGSIRTKEHKYASKVDIKQLRCYKKLNETEETNSLLSVGALGGGNHFIEVDKNDNGELYLVIHSGSHCLGKAVATYYQKAAHTELKELKGISVPEGFAYCEGQLFEDYIHDMKLVQQYAAWSRKAMRDEILTNMGLTAVGGFTTIHNYIDTDAMILRKGAVSAKNGEKLIIPINMRDGSLICIGKGNTDWNESAPHGAGRLMSRAQAKASISLDEFKKSMEGIFTTSVATSTLDESPMAYKSISDIVDNIGDTVDICEIIKPVYNFKAGGDRKEN